MRSQKIYGRSYRARLVGGIRIQPGEDAACAAANPLLRASV
jgi:hypothetical protein